MSSKRSAFTLIELMIVVTIMSTLSPSLSHKYADYPQRTRDRCRDWHSQPQKPVDQCTPDTPQLVGCSANSNQISVNRDAGQITVVTEAASGNANLQLMLIPNFVNSSTLR